MSLIGRHDNAFANLHQAAKAGLKHGAIGYLNTDWGDGGHPQPLAVSYLPYLLGAALSWCAQAADETLLVPVLSRDIFHDPTQRMAKAALGLGLAHRKLDYYAGLGTPLGTAISAPVPQTRELMCRDGLKYYARIPAKNIRAAQDEVEAQRAVPVPLTAADRRGGSPRSRAGHGGAHGGGVMPDYAVAAGCGRRQSFAGQADGQKPASAPCRNWTATSRAYWPLRNNGTTAKCAAVPALAHGGLPACHSILSARGGAAGTTECQLGALCLLRMFEENTI